MTTTSDQTTKVEEFGNGIFIKWTDHHQLATSPLTRGYSFS
jgi:hypothetical protein